MGLLEETGGVGLLLWKMEQEALKIVNAASSVYAGIKRVVIAKEGGWFVLRFFYGSINCIYGGNIVNTRKDIPRVQNPRCPI